MAQDEVLLQIETDKVTIDVRAPEAGVVVNVLVAEEDTVAVGQAVAILTQDSDGGYTAAFTPAAAPAAAPAAPVSGAYPAARTPSISFPARLTPDGHRVSSLPAAARASTVQAALGGSASAGVAPKFWKPVPASPPSAFAPPAGFADAAPVRMGMSEEEIDAVDLGGALPS